MEVGCHVCECQLAEKRRIAQVRKRVERGEFFVKHGSFELLLAIAELSRELVGLVQVNDHIVVKKNNKNFKKKTKRIKKN